ncbi:MAG: CocE/NonD family hydrolase [Bryobacteraceae bacterium]
MRIFVLLLAPIAATAQDFLALGAAAEPAPERMLAAYLKSAAARQLAERKAEVAAIGTKEAYERRKERMRQAALSMIGGLDDPRTPLNARVTGTLVRDGYRVEKLVYESRPRFFVTANLYVPTTGRGPFPAILHPVGHSTSAKNRAFYQKISIALVKTGFVVLIYDPIGQGERRIFWDPALGDSKVGGTTQEHSMIGWQSVLGGESVARYRIWDGMRGIDYLLTRPEVDRDKIGVTGCSGGGTLTAYIAALDDRVKAAAPACYISSWEQQLEGTGPQDAEQQFPDQLVKGLNHADWIGLAAPKPYLIVSTDQDFFPLEGARASFQEMKRIYGLYDAEAKIDWFHEPGGHGVPTASREAICTWMKQWLRGEPGAVKQPEPETEHEEDLNVTPTGQVASSLGGETASTWNMRRFASRVPARPALRTKEDATRYAASIRKKMPALTRYRASSASLDLQHTGRTEHQSFPVELLRYRSDDGLLIPAALCGTGPKSAMYLDPRGKAAALKGPDVAELVKLGYTVLVPDLSGIGEVAFRRYDTAPWGYPQVAWLALMTGRPLVGIRMNDIVRSVDALRELGKPADAVVAIAQGRLGVGLLHAAAVDSRIHPIVEQSLVSYRAAATNPIHRDLEDAVVPGVLGSYDLPDLAAAIAPRPLTIANAISPNGRLLLRAEARREYEFAAQAYRAAGAAGNLEIGLRKEGETLASAYPLLRR